ncbi:hypothetical protein EAG_00865 [Camponotus floridanus]|uniref:Uncharacterized protein n=1 Tax=Camponotus floridanus TaxID=104421 RepID=E2AQA1_CAMFO|nr:hypothetical protein EAG_00865 [Camponotus floridanus]
MIITRSAVTVAATVTTTTTTTTTKSTTTARWALLLKRDTLGRIYHNGQRRSTRTAALRSDASSAMLSRDCGRRALHGDDSSNSTDRISGSSTVIALALPYYYYYCYRYYCKYVAALLVDDEKENLLIASIPTQHKNADADNNEALVTAISDRRDGLRCCA